MIRYDGHKRPITLTTASIILNGRDHVFRTAVDARKYCIGIVTRLHSLLMGMVFLR